MVTYITFLLNSKAEKYHVEQIFWYSKMIGNFSINWSSRHETCESDCYVSNHFLNCISCLNDCYKFNLLHHMESTDLMKLLTNCHSRRLPVGYHLTRQWNHYGRSMEPNGNEGIKGCQTDCKGVDLGPITGPTLSLDPYRKLHSIRTQMEYAELKLCLQ